MAAQQIVTLLGAHDHAEEAFLCGLLLDVGVPLVCGCDPAVWGETAVALDSQDAAARREREHSLYGTCHAEVGRRALERLRVPKLYADAAALHHDGFEPLAAAMAPDLARAIDIVATIPHRLLKAQQALQGLSVRVRMLPGITAPAAAERSMRAVAMEYTSVLRLLGDEDEAGAPFKQFLQETSAVVAASVCGAVEEAQSTITQLRARESGLTQQVEGLRQQVIASDIDSLTRVFTRGAFMKRIPPLLAGLRQYGATCAVGYVDVDNFKALNDVYGHAAGDEALRRVAQRLTEVVQPRGLVGRVGGDEFVFVVVSRRPFTSEEVQQRFGGPMTSLSIDVADRTIPFSTSIGLFDAGIPAETDTAEGLFARADRLMYGSKKSGKGRCLFARLSEAGEAAA
jgi:diguanylate cyclase (GGDEF)-like protein